MSMHPNGHSCSVDFLGVDFLWIFFITGGAVFITEGPILSSHDDASMHHCSRSLLKLNNLHAPIRFVTKSAYS